MATYPGRVSEVRLGLGGELEALITCPPGAVPPAGRYLSAYAPVEVDVPLATALFLSQITPGGFWATSPFPSSWIPGTELILRGPLGKGFELPNTVSRLALAALDASPARLLPLARAALERDCAVTLFTATPMPGLASTIEIYPLDSLHEAMSWPDLLALDLPLERLPTLGARLGLSSAQPLPCSVQVLVWTAMPCSGLAECAVCAVPSRRGYKLACLNGPVFPLEGLEW
jgi:dihydroorotate dehydrogenase electron transfer subunit